MRAFLHLALLSIYVQNGVASRGRHLQARNDTATSTSTSTGSPSAIRSSPPTSSASTSPSATATASACPEGYPRQAVTNGTRSGTACVACAAGKYDGDANGTRTCVDCLGGQGANGTASTQCAQCPAGSASALGRPCQKCPPARYSNASGSEVCTPCPSGMDTSAIRGAPATSAASCSFCPVKTFAAQPGDVCAPCPPGSITLATGQTSCLFLDVQCLQDTTPQAPLLRSVLTQAQCVPLACPRYMGLTPGGRACAGCPYGAFGSVGACRGCASSCRELGLCGNVSCPGFLPLPLVADPATLAANRSGCVAGAALGLAKRSFTTEGLLAAFATTLLVAVGALGAALVLCFCYCRLRHRRARALEAPFQSTRISDGYWLAERPHEWRTDPFRFVDRAFTRTGLHASVFAATHAPLAAAAAAAAGGGGGRGRRPWAAARCPGAGAGCWCQSARQRAASALCWPSW